MVDIPLTEHERAVLMHYRDHGTPPEARRAQIILMSEQAATLDQIREAVSLSQTQVRRWLKQWEECRLDIFPTLPDSGDEFYVEVTLPPQTQTQEIPVIDTPGLDGPRLPLELRPTIGVLPDDPMPEAGRKVLLFHFERMLQHEPGSRLGNDIEAVHDMRVATRRMRSALRLFRPFFDADTIRPFRRHLRALGTQLGAVRDLDVLLHKANLFSQANPGADLTPLVESWQAELAEARKALSTHLDRKKFDRFVHQFHSFLLTPGEGVQPLPARGDVVAYQVRHVAPQLIYQLYENVRAYEVIGSTTDVPVLHGLRIEFKRLRYALEFFAEVLGPEAKRVIQETKTMQDHLGDLNDAYVAGQMLRDFIDEHRAHYSGTPVFMRPDISGVEQYAAAKAAEQQQLLDSFPQVWQHFLSEQTRRNLALAVANL